MIKYSFIAATLAIILFACNNDVKQQPAKTNSTELTQHQKDERNKAIVLKCIAAYAANDSEYILAQNAQNVVNIYSGQPPIHGIDSCRIVLRDAFHSFTYKPSNQTALADNNYVFVFLYAKATMIKSHKTDDAKMVEIFKFNDDGKIILHTAVGEAVLPKDARISL